MGKATLFAYGLPIMLAVGTTLLHGKNQAATDAEAYIISLPTEIRVDFLNNYLYGAWVYSKFLKFRQTPAVFVSCPDKGCDPLPLQALGYLQAQAPKTLGNRIAEREAAQIEIYIAPESAAFDVRDREIDSKLHLNVNYTSRKAHFGEGFAPCWTATYFDKGGVIHKSLIFIDSDSSPVTQYLCMGFESVRATGIMSVPSFIAYRKYGIRPEHTLWHNLAATAYLHGLSEIKPGDTFQNALSILAQRYGLEKASFGLTSP